jgi:hypothetical protein
MKNKFAGLLSKSFYMFFSIGFCVIFAQASYGQGNDKVVLLVESRITLKPAVPGQAGWDTKVKGEAYLHAQANGRFAGTGELSVTYEFLHSPNPYFKYSTMKGQGSFNVKGIKEGKNLRFWFEHVNIPVRGTLTVSMPHVSETKPYVTTFDPHTIAPGGPEPENGVTIELRDGATGAIEIPGAGKTTFTLRGVELWRVSVVGEETDKVQPYIQNKKLRNDSKELPIAVQFKWKLIGEFTVIGKGGNRSFLNGQIFSALIDPVLLFEHHGLYKCQSEECPDTKNPDELVGQAIGGSASGNSVRLKWPPFFPIECILCRPQELYLGGLPYHAKFGTKEFMETISREELPLKDGQTVKGGIQDWMKYTITLQKLD